MMLFWTAALASLGLDVLVKLLAARFLQEQTIRIGWLAEFRLTHNTGMAFGMLADQAAAGVLLPLAVIFCGWLLMRRYRSTRFTRVACGLVVGGFMGNFVQRIAQGYVLDMIYFPWLPFFVCNAADICICFGVALLAFSLIWRPQDWEESVTKDAEN